MQSGVVFNIQKFSIHDGPGIRTTVFLKGCPLRCSWCHNPESWLPEPEIQVVESRCRRCGRCLESCPERATGDRGPAKCRLCGACVEACPTGARRWIGRRMTVGEALGEILRDRVFYDDSGGGATFSGGEPLAQPEFLVALLEACRAGSIHTALDTAGHAPREVLLDAARLADLVLYDLKIVDEDLHRRHTGVSNAAILDNLRALCGVHGNVWLRVPIVPGFNDAAEQVAAMAELAASLPGILRVSVLGYHKLGSHKPARGRETLRHDVTPPDTRFLEEVAETFRALGTPARVGG